MVKQILPAIAFIVFLSSCSSFKTLNFTSNKKVETDVPDVSKSKFIEDITVTPQPNVVNKSVVRPETRNLFVTPASVKNDTYSDKKSSDVLAEILARRSSPVEKASPVQLKYAILLDTEVESLPNTQLLQTVDEWYGVRYRFAGNTKKGVDCSGFTVAIYSALYGIMLPRISREQYRTSRKISTTELEEGDLVFFDTRGGGSVSHVGVYLGNNKFIHASVSKGVMVNDLFESYYLKRFVGAGRIDNKSIAGAIAPTP
jgi:cell wall-associated NlpC family hydrolase